MRGRGLKPVQAAGGITTIRSLPMRGRGLKQATIVTAIDWLSVAPHAGAWIETY